MTSPRLEIALAAWGNPLPDWVAVLVSRCDQTSQAEVARLLERSGAVVSQVLRKTYSAEMARIEERVRGVFMAGRVACPSLGEMPVQTCQDWRDLANKYAAGGPMRRRMFHACRACPRLTLEEE